MITETADGIVGNKEAFSPPVDLCKPRQLKLHFRPKSPRDSVTSDTDRMAFLGVGLSKKVHLSGWETKFEPS